MSDDPLPLGISLLLIVALVFLNGFFVAAQLAMVKVRSSRISALVSEGNGKARFASRLTGSLDSFVSVCQLGITLASLGLGWVGEPAVAALLEPLLLRFGIAGPAAGTLSFVAAFGCIALFHIVLGQLAPKTLAIRQAEKVTLWTSRPLILLHALLYPAIRVLDGMAGRLLRWSGLESAAGTEPAHNEEELRLLMQESRRSGLIDPAELALMDNIFDFAGTQAREIMIPRTDMICLYVDRTLEENKAAALQRMHTRYPVCDGDKDDVIGFVHIKDLLRAGAQTTNWHGLIRPVAAVPASTRIQALLARMQQDKTQLAILIDEYGGTAGLVTLEDIVEEIVGDITDEFDAERNLRDTGT
ncbi:HlyC/CorC family transporter [Paenibacillus albicereus]|uniref:HlyC/CorC family transporter n=1 Tax=Paenibacillus albicereus TaxID=2726185 RepID=A0A6H2GZM3_9BACL|nr:hemolysin family protein [Paenibacillus albicereus]QJC52847.1 HlyC/CorC family transporter [Paenibacillus albicereus]